MSIDQMKKYGIVRVQENRLILVPHKPLPLALVQKLREGNPMVSGPITWEVPRDETPSAR